MKKSLLALTAALSFGFAAAQDTAPAAPAAQVPALTDVPAGHWAKDAIDRLVSQGIILGYPDGTFRGTQNLTRYEAAVIIARLLNQMGTAQAPVMDSETMTSLQNAIQELAADLAALGVRVSDLEENAVTKDDFARLEQRVEELGSMAPAGEMPAPFDNSDNEQTQADLQDQVSAVQDQVASNSDAISELQGAQGDMQAVQDQVSGIQVQVDTNTQGQADLQDQISGVQDQVDANTQGQADLQDQVAGIQDQVDANTQGQADLQDQISGVQDQVAANSDAIADLQGQISDFTARADDLQANYDTLRADVDDNASSIAALNDLTVLLNGDILNLQDRASAIEAAQADFVQRADFDNLVGRVAVVETKVTDVQNTVTDYGKRIALLEKNAFSIKPTIKATYFVARADRDMDIDRLFLGTEFSTGDDGDSGTVDTPVDYVDLANSQTKVVNSAGGLYGFSTDAYRYSVVLTNPTTGATRTVNYTSAQGAAFTPSAGDTAAGFTQVGTPTVDWCSAGQC